MVPRGGEEIGGVEGKVGCEMHLFVVFAEGVEERLRGEWWRVE